MSNRITQYLDPPPLHHAAPTNVTLADDLRSICRQAMYFLGAGFVVGAFLVGMAVPVVAAVWVVFYR